MVVQKGFRQRVIEIGSKVKNRMMGALRSVSPGGWLYFFSALGLAIAAWMLANPDTLPDIFSDLIASRTYWAYTAFVIIGLSGCIITLVYIQRLSASGAEDSGGVPAPSTPYNVTIEFLLARSDQLDEARSNLRSGVNILLGIFIAVVLWLLNTQSTQGRELTYPEATLLSMSITIVLFSVIGVFFSFADTSVYSDGALLKEGLMPTGQSEEVFSKQLKEVVSKKQDIIKRMKQSVGIGLWLFIIVGGISLFNPLIENLPDYPNMPVIDAASSAASGLMLCFMFLLALAVVATLGIFSFYEEEPEK